MKNARFLFSLSLLAALNLFSQDPAQPISPELVAEQLKDAEKEFEEAKKMFNPWYAGPLLTPGAHILSPGNINIQPYLFLTNNYKKYDSSGSAQNISHLKTINPSLVVQFGMLSWLDGVISVQTVSNWQQGHSSTNFGDTSFSLGFGLLDEGAYRPAVLISLKETFPTGKYSNLSSTLGGVDASGAGAYATSINLNVAKVVWWVLEHPMNLRASLGYTFPTVANVKGFHAYGGGFGTKGKIHTSNVVSLEAAMEYSFTQKWVFAVDAVYNYASQTKFVGQKGQDEFGNIAANGGPFNDNLSFAPAIEYNPNPNLGLLAGVWFSVWGRNSLDFVSGVLSITYTF
jgi:hypothetical protein